MANVYVVFFQSESKVKSRSKVKVISIDGKPFSQETSVPNIKVVGLIVQKLWLILTFLSKVGQRSTSRSEVKVIGMNERPLS